MKEMKQNRKIKYTQMVLQDSLMELMERKPFSKITIKELCEAADINRTTFYAHYTDQNSLLHEIEAEVLLSARNFVTSLSVPMDRNGIMRITQEFLQYIADNNKHIQVLLGEQGDVNFQKDLFATIYEHCGIAISAAYSSTKEFYFIFVLNGSVGMIQHWLKSGLTKSATEMAEIIFNMFNMAEQIK